MPFKKLEAYPYPRRLWGLVGFPGKGKSTFAAQMRAPLLPIDADHRFDEVVKVATGDVYSLSDAPADNVLVERIAECLRANMPGAPVRTIVVDSLTAIIAPLVVQAVMANDAGRNKNKMSSFKAKALAMRLLQDAVGMWGTDVLYIYHLQEGRNENAEKQVTTTVSRTELARLTRSINLQLRVVEDGKRLGIHVDWARRGRSGMSLWDESGTWKGMPERVEEAVYGGLTREQMDQIERSRPATFASVEQAIAWGMDQGCFGALQHARNAYDKMLAEHEPEPGQETWDLWLAEVETRQAELAAEKESSLAPRKAQPAALAPAAPANGKSAADKEFEAIPSASAQASPAQPKAREQLTAANAAAAPARPAGPTVGQAKAERIDDDGSYRWAPGEAANALKANPGVYKTAQHPWPGEFVVAALRDLADWAGKNPGKAKVDSLQLSAVGSMLGRVAAKATVPNGEAEFCRQAFGVASAAEISDGEAFALTYWAKFAADRETGELIPAAYVPAEALRVMHLAPVEVPF